MCASLHIYPRSIMKPTNLQDPGDYTLWTAIFKASKARFIDDGDSSLIRCLDQSKADQLSVKDFQELLRRQTIVLTACNARSGTSMARHRQRTLSVERVMLLIVANY